jgi:hypothetical protein
MASSDDFAWGDESVKAQAPVVKLPSKEPKAPVVKLPSKAPQDELAAQLREQLYVQPEAKAVNSMDDLPIPSRFISAEARAFFLHVMVRLGFCVIFRATESVQTITDFFKKGRVGTLCYVHRDTSLRGFFENGFGRVQATEIVTVYLFNSDIKSLLSSLGAYCHSFLGGCPFAFVDSFEDLRARDFCVAYGFSNTSSQAATETGRPQPVHFLDMSNLRVTRKY